MRILLSIVLAGCLPALAEPDAATRLESLLAEAQRAQARSDYRAAAAEYRKAVSIRPDMAELWSNLGLMQYEAREYPQAEEAFRRALAINKSLFVPNLFLGLNLLELKHPHEAVGYLLTAQKGKPQDDQVLLALGRAFHALSDPAQSRQWYQRAADIAPRNGNTWFGLGVANLDLAEAASTKLTRTFRQSPYVAELTADALAEQGRLAEAIDRYRVLLASGEEPPRCARTAYGFLLLRHGDRAQADEQFGRDLELCPAAKVGKARVWSQDGDPREKAQAMVPSPPERLLPALGKMNEDQLQHLAGDAFFSGDYRTAASAADQLEQLHPNHAAGWYWAVRAYQQLGVAALARASEVEPESPRIHALLGDVYQQRKMFREAQEEYSKMLALEPDSMAGLAGLAGAYLGEGQVEAAEATTRKALHRDSTDNELNLLMGEILVVEHKYAEAKPYLEHSLKARPDLLPRVHALLGRVYARIGRPKEAIAELTQGLASDEDGSVYYQLARLYQSAGDAKAATAAFQKSQQIRARRDLPPGFSEPLF